MSPRSGTESRRPPRISLHLALVTETWPPEVNGVAHTLARLVEGMRDRGHRVQVFRPRQPGEALALRDDPDARDPGDRLLPGLPIPGYSGLRMGLPARRRLQGLWTENRPDAVYIATEGPLGHSALGAARRLGIPVIAGFHTHFDGYARYYGVGWLTPAVRSILRRFHNRCDVTLAPTQALAATLAAQGFERVRVMARGVDTRRFTPARRSSRLRRQWGAGTATPVVLYVGRLAPEKNLALVIEAFRALQPQLPEARLVLVGDGPSRAALERAHTDVIFTGQQVGQALAQHYASADLFLFPSTSETFGNVVIEAMASGLPVLAFDTAAAHEHVTTAVSGVRVPLTGEASVDAAAFAGAAAALAQDSEAWGEMGRNARAHARGLDWVEVVAGFEAHCLGTLKEARDASPAMDG
ncbi:MULTISPECIES: glycosyltransferase family 1 protein [unclassified Thioalkalivibrio]|uniref:glycosyltransferase family 4 protein n=1 Tax=unclassified Thioalkalivibrio TaxID=2621013 RepID=UPI0003712D31|nr:MULTISPECIES: glycosyltransferase family 1 protein [unclassified Thioalkalivibrio]